MSRALGHYGRRRSARFSATFLIDAEGWPDLPPSYPLMDLAVPIPHHSLFELNMSTTQGRSHVEVVTLLFHHITSGIEFLCKLKFSNLKIRVTSCIKYS
jgi:hypothetical protein